MTGSGAPAFVRNSVQLAISYGILHRCGFGFAWRLPWCLVSPGRGLGWDVCGQQGRKGEVAGVATHLALRVGPDWLAGGCRSRGGGGGGAGSVVRALTLHGLQRHIDQESRRVPDLERPCECLERAHLCEFKQRSDSSRYAGAGRRARREGGRGLPQKPLRRSASHERCTCSIEGEKVQIRVAVPVYPVRPFFASCMSDR